MLSRTSDRIVDAVRLLGAVGAIATDPTLLSAVKAGPGGYDALKKLIAAPPPGVTRLAGELAASARIAFNQVRELPPDADVLYLDMVNAGLVAAPEIVAAGMDAHAVTEAMVAKLTEREHRTGPMLNLFRRLTEPALARMLADNAFADDLRAAFMAEVLRRLGDLGAALEDTRRLRRVDMVALGDRFGLADMFRLSDAELRKDLEKRAEDSRALKAEVETLRAATPRIDNVLAAVEAALERLDLVEAESLLAGVRETTGEALRKPLEDNALIMEAQARVALLRGAVEQASGLLSAAADSFATLDALEPARRRIDFADRLYTHELRYGGGGAGLTLAEQMLRRALDDLSKENTPALWAKTQNNLGNALRHHGERLGGEGGIRSLREAATAYRAAMQVWTEAAYTVDWANTQTNLGVALQAQAARLRGPARARLLAEAVAVYRVALGVQTEAAHPVDWARTQNNLGIALWAQGERLGDALGTRLLEEAVATHRAALRVWTEAAYPENWARAKNNIGIALETLGGQFGGAAGAAMLSEAVAAYRAALQVRTEAAHPVAWAMTQNNLGAALQTHGKQLLGAAGAVLLGEAVEAYRAALRVRTEMAHPVEWAMTTENIGLALESLAQICASDPCEALRESAACFAAALRTYDPEHMPYYRDKCAASLARVRDKLARDCA